MAIAKRDRRLLALRGRGPPQGDRQEDPRADGLAEGQVHRGLRSPTTTADSVARQLWEDMEKAQDYSFNKSHAACYALISYRTAWLRAHHPCEYMAALISSVMNTKDRVPFYVNACHELGIEVLPPDVNESQIDFAVVGGKIRFGLNAVKGVGELACRTIIRAREEGGPFESIWDFTERVDPSVVNKRALESLVKCGALPGSRHGDARRCSSRRSPTGRSSRPTGWPGRARSSTASSTRPRPRLERHHPPVPAEEFEKPDLLRLEKETLGLYVSEHPLSALRAELRAKTDATIAELERRRDGESVIGRAESSARSGSSTTKRGEQMVFLRLDDVTGGDRLRRLQLDLRRRARAVLARPDRDRQGPGRPQGGRDEADRAGGLGLRVGRASGARCGSGSTPRARRPGRSASSQRSSASSPARARSSSTASPRRARSCSGSARGYRVQPDADFYAEVRALLGESALA